MTIKQAKSELMQIYGALSPDKQRAIDTLVKTSENSQAKWIPISEELPKEYSDILLTINGCKGLKVRSGMYYEGGSFHSDTGEFWKTTDIELIAWQPLPQPYRGRK